VRTVIHTLVLTAIMTMLGDHKPRVSIAYELTIQQPRVDLGDVSITFRDAPDTFHLAMRVHGEYDAQYWRYIANLRIESGSTQAARITQLDSTLWRVSLPGGSGVVRYRVMIQPPPSAGMRVWKPYARADGAMINPPDFFLYSPELAQVPVTLHLAIPRSWKVATALPLTSDHSGRAADALTLLDSPLLLGNLHAWSFSEAGTRYHVAYWPLPNGSAFDTLAFVDGLHRLAHATVGVFGAAPTRDYWFLIEDGAGDALEHRASVTVGVNAARLARDPNDAMQEIAHEFFHAWNLVAIRPAGYNELSYRAPRRTPSLWIGEGITIYYADVLRRRAGLIDTSARSSRLEHVTRLLERYYGSPVYRSVSPVRASLALGDSPADNTDATGGYYLQGELLAGVLDALVRDSTHESKGLDDIMRAMFARGLTSAGRGYSEDEFERVADSVCNCRLDEFFARQVRGGGPIDVRPELARLGLRAEIDSVPATDTLGNALPDLRLGIDFTIPASPRVVIRDSSTSWAVAGLRTGDQLISIAGEPVHSFGDFQRAVSGLRVSEDASAIPVEIQRHGQRMRFSVPVAGYRRARVRLIDAATVTSAERARRDAWLRGRSTR
jgi:predicted metalloprotease with PDZ domain